MPDFINLAKRADPKVVERFKIGSCTEGLFTGEYKWTGVKTVQVYSVDNLPVVDYGLNNISDEADATTGFKGKWTSSGSRFGDLYEVGDTMQEMTITQDKAFNGTIDKGNDTNQLMIKAAGKVLRRQTDEVLIPMVDKYRLNQLALHAGTISTLSSALAKDKIIESIMTANALMSDKLVPDTGRVLYMSYQNAVKLKLSSEIISIDKLGEKAVVNGVAGKIDKTQIRLVPSSYLPANCVFLIVKTGVALAPKKIETFRVLKNTYLLDGAIVQGRLMHDCFVLDTKKDGILAAYASGTTGITGATGSIGP